MVEFQRILFPVDFLQTTTRVVPYVLSLTDKYQAELHLLHVTEDLDHWANFYVPHPSIHQMAEELQAGAQKKMAQLVKEELGDHQVKTQVSYGDVAEEIVRYAQEHKVDLIVMGSHGAKGLERTLFGSVAGRVVRKSPVPVLVVNPFRSKSA